MLSFWISSLQVNPPAEFLTFDILYGEKTVGELTASLVKAGGKEIYESKTTVRANLIKKIEVQYLGSAVFQDGILQSAKVKSLFNGDVFADGETRKVGNDYQFYENGKLKRTVKGPITFSVLQLTFVEPTGISTVYSEEAGVMQEITAGGNGAYSKLNSRGRTNRYQYSSQDLQKIWFDGGIVEFEMKRKK